MIIHMKNSIQFLKKISYLIATKMQIYLVSLIINQDFSKLRWMMIPFHGLPSAAYTTFRMDNYTI